MRPRRLIHDIKKPVLNLYFRFEFFIRKLDHSLCTSLITRLKRIPQKCDYILDRTRTSLCKQLCKQPGFLQITRISLLDEKLDSQNNGRNIILFYVYFGKLFYFNIFIIIVLGYKRKKYIYMELRQVHV